MIKLTPYQIGILTMVAEYRFVPSTLFFDLLGPASPQLSSIPEDANEKTKARAREADERLRRYYLGRLEDPLRMIKSVQLGDMNPKAYFLRPSGADYLFHLTGKRYRYADIQSTQNYLHDSEVTRQHILIKRALTGAGMDVLHIERHPSKLQEWTGRKKDLSVNPDMIVLYRNPRKAEQQVTVVCHDPQVGKEKITDGVLDTLTKIRAYQEWYASGQFADSIEERFATRPDLLRVCFTFNTEYRAESFAEDCAEDELTFQRYRFTSHEALHEDSLGQIWVTPKDLTTRKYGYLE